MGMSMFDKLMDLMAKQLKVIELLISKNKSRVIRIRLKVNQILTQVFSIEK